MEYKQSQYKVILEWESEEGKWPTAALSGSVVVEKGIGSKLKERGFKLHMKKEFFTRKEVGTETSCPKKPPSLKTFKVRLHGALSNPVYCKVFLPIAWRLEMDGP